MGPAKAASGKWGLLSPGSPAQAAGTPGRPPGHSGPKKSILLTTLQLKPPRVGIADKIRKFGFWRRISTDSEQSQQALAASTSSTHRQQAHAASTGNKHRQRATAASSGGKHEQQSQAASTRSKHTQQARTASTSSKHRQPAEAASTGSRHK